MLRRAFACLASGLALVLTTAGCDEPLSLPLQTTEPVAEILGTTFDAEAAGNVTGQVTWSGPVPAVPPFKAPLSTGTEGRDRLLRSWANPHAPAVDPASRGVAGAVVFLRGVEPGVARPWDLPLVQIEMKDGQFHVYQGTGEQRAGFLRSGDPVAMVSWERWFELLQARGAAFFSLAFPEPGLVRTRLLQQPGYVELISGAGHYWMRGHLFVVAHPYYTNTNGAGRFTLPQVPPGDYQLVCWHPSWHTASRERDIGTLLYTHLTFRPSLEVIQPIRVERGTTANAMFRLAADDFDPQ